jgi:hypothetical protein
MPHWHADDWRTAVVLSGTFYFGVDEQWDESKLKAYPARNWRACSALESFNNHAAIT